MMLTIGSLFSGIGGFELGFEHEGFETRWFIENDPYCQKVLRKHWPDVPIYGDIRAIDFGTLERVDVLTGGFPCFAAGTFVLSDKGYIPIEDIKIGNSVLTHRGQWKKVTRISKREDIKLYEVRGTGILPTMVTSEHPYFVRERKFKWDNKKRAYTRSFSLPEWKQVRDINQGYFAAQVLPEIKTDNHSPSFWWLVGRYLADGWRVARKGRKNGRVVICCAIKEENEIRERIKQAGFNSTCVREGAISKFHITKGCFYEFLEPFGRLASGKRLPAEALSLDAEKSEALFLGWASGDGHRNKKHNMWSVTTVSKSLALGMALLAQRFGRVASVYHTEMPERCTIQGRTTNQHDQYNVRVCDSNRTSFIEGEYGWTNIKKCGYTEKRGTVYNISVDDDESYIANGAIVHNCQDISTANPKGKGIEGERSGLWSYFAEAIRVLQPRYAVIENVPNLANRGLNVVLSDLAEIGYDAEWNIVSARGVGARHLRRRIFIVAYPSGTGTGDNTRPACGPGNREEMLRPGRAIEAGGLNTAGTDAALANCSGTVRQGEDRTLRGNGGTVLANGLQATTGVILGRNGCGSDMADPTINGCAGANQKPRRSDTSSESGGIQAGTSARWEGSEPARELFRGCEGLLAECRARNVQGI